MLLSDTLTILNLSEHELAVWYLIATRPYNISRLARATRIPRTTLYTAIASLKKRGMAKTRASGRSTMVSAADNEELADLLTSSAALFQKEGTIRTAIKVPTGESTGFTLVHGKQAMVRIWEDLAAVKNGRIYCIQPTRSARSFITQFPPGTFIPINQKIKQNHVIMDTILKEDCFPMYLSLYEGNTELQKKIIDSFIGRIADTTIVHNEFLNNNADLLIAGDAAYLLCWPQEVGIKIENAHMVEFLMELFKLAKGYGKKLDLNEYMREWNKRITSL
jgi:hypothetical protein